MGDTLTLEEFERGLSPARPGFSPVPRREPDRLSVEEFERGLLKADGPEVLSVEQFEAREAAPAAPSLVRSALHGIVQGAAGGVAGFPEAVGTGRQGAARGLLAQYDKIDRGSMPDKQYRMLGGPAMFYMTSDVETRQRLKDEARTAIRPIAEEPAFQLGQRIRESTAGAFPVAPEHEGRFPVQLGRGFGSTATFAATGLAGRVLRLPILPVVAGTGAVVNSAATFRDAIDRGASFEDAFKASRMSGVAGTSEAFPIVKLLGRLDDASGRQIRRLIVRAAQGGIEEGSQELFQNVFDNLIASKLVPYDPERGLFMGSGEAVGIGFTVGSLLNALASMLGAKMRRSPKQVTEETVREFKEHVVREPEGAPTSAERGAPFEQAPAPVVSEPRLAPPKPRKRPVRSKPLTLAEFLAARGGVQDQTGELKAMDAHRWHREKPYRNRLVRDDGLSPDYAREAASEAGYLKPDSVIDDLYQALDRDLRGQRVYSEQDMTEVLTREAEAAGQVDRAELEEYAHRLELPSEVIERMDDATLANAITYEQAARGLAEGGEQAVIPGAERISDRALAERRMAQPLRPGALQRPADEGLFDVSGRGQRELSLEEFEQRYPGQAERTTSDAPVASGGIRRTVRTSAGPAEVIFPDALHERLFNLARAQPNRAEVRDLHGSLESFVLERFDKPSDVISLAREYRQEVLDRAALGVQARGGRPEYAPLVIDPVRQSAYFMQDRVGKEAAGFYSGLTPTLPRFAQATGIERPKGRYAGSINLDRLNTPEEIKRAIGFVSKQESGFKEARRGKISWKETEVLAADLGLTVQKLRARRRGQAFNAEQIEAARTLHLASAENLHLLAKKATESGAYEDVLAFDKAYHQHVAIQAEIEGSATEAGRALNIHRKLAAAARGEKAEYIKEIIQSTGGRSSMEELMGHIASLDAEGVGRYVQKAKKSTAMEKLREAWYMALLSDVPTQGVNIGSNAIVSLWTVPEHAVSGVIGKLHGGEKVYLREVFGRAYGVLQGAKTGLRMAYNAFESEVPSDLLSKVETQRMKAIPSVRLRKGKEKKRVGRVRIPLTGEIEIGGKQVRIPGRALLAGDEFFKAIGYSQKLHELAIRDGIQKGKRGADLLAHVREIKRDVPEGMHSQARRAARVQTFTEPLGKAGQAAMNVRERVGTIGWVIAPFMRTPVNIFKFTMKRTPAPLLYPKGEVWEQIRAGGAERDIALGRIAFGSGIMALIANYAAAGLVTGAGPDDPAEKALLRTTGWQPYSFKVGNEYFSYFYYEPLGSLFGMGADFAEIRARYPEIAREEEWDRLAAMIVGSITNNLTNKTYTRGVSTAIRAIDDPSTAGERWVRGLTGTLIPTGIAGTARRGDPVLRDARSILDNFKSRIPGLRETLPPRLDPFGREIRNEGALGPDIASRIYRSTERPDKVVDEMLRLKVTLSRPRRVIQGVKLTPEQYIEFVQLLRQGAKEELDRFVNAPGWDSIRDFAKRDIIKDTFKFWRDGDKNNPGAVEKMFARHPELLRTQTRQRLEAVTK